MAGNWVEHALRRSVWKPERQVFALATLGVVIALLLGALYLFQVANEASINNELREMQTQRDELERLNQELRSEIAALTSVPNLQVRARELGFQLAGSGQIEYLLVADYYPDQADTVASITADLSNEDDPDNYDETFVDWFGNQLESIGDTLSDILGG